MAFRVRQIAAEIILPAYSETKLRAFIVKFPRYMTDPEEVCHVPRGLAQCGIRFLIVETLPRASIDGVCFWQDNASPVFGMTVRQDRIDNFWFVLRHELEHVLQKDGRGELSADKVDVDPEGSGAGETEISAEERQANAAAADFCVPATDMESFYARKAPFISERDTLGFAARVQRHPGIVVGQLQRRMGRYDWLARYKVKVRQFVADNCTVDGWGVPAPVSL